MIHPTRRRRWSPGPRVGNVENNDPSLIEPVAGAG
jgi:hypothetical protein